nr:hypothetical protein Iba_chr01aCG13990 [Ipomoea batatas]GMC50126.1 hypothetical protein Iba_chr01bCG14120 [Ipomoea batatas]GMC54000.1 hypothetical protein Iba_chr01dCG11980 [Ipomoea batatas]GMC54722.1 hypothetical protein Iba_chr01eCG0620 [Ipomoea batatas]GMC55821.1 hypothetical protein Iba_chr01fCG1280 [Ipomoea batatas]
MGGHFINQTCLSALLASKLMLVAVAVVLVGFSAISGGDEERRALREEVVWKIL